MQRDAADVDRAAALERKRRMARRHQLELIDLVRGAHDVHGSAAA
jgi:hypothetical protein